MLLIPSTLIVPSISVASSTASPKSQAKEFSFKQEVCKVYYQEITASGAEAFAKGHERWIWGSPNQVLKVSESSADFRVELEDQFDDSNLVAALKNSRRFTEGSFLGVAFPQDKILRHFSDDEWDLLFENIITLRGVNIKIFRLREDKSRVFGKHPLYKREITSIYQAETLGLSSPVIDLIESFANDVKWPANRLTRVHQSERSFAKTQMQQRNACGFGTSATPGVTVGTVRQQRRSKVSWNTIVLYPFSFDWMVFHANCQRLPINVSFGYIMLLVASNLSRPSPGLFDSPYALGPHEDVIYPFRDWVLGCAIAGRVADKYAQSSFGILVGGMNLATEISKLLRKMRYINLKIIRHVMQSRNPNHWNTFCGYDAHHLFENVDSQWHNILGSPKSVSTTVLSAYLSMFSPRAMSSKLHIDRIKAILQLPVMFSTVRFKIKHHLREEGILGRSDILNSVNLMKAHLKIVMGSSEIIDHQEEETRLTQLPLTLRSSLV